MAASERSADVVVIGAGIIGLSIAYQLVRRGAGRVVVLEKGAAPAGGSTGASSACLRLRYSQDDLVRMAHAGVETFRRWPEYTGLASPRAAFAHTGVLWMLGEDRATVEGERDRMAAAGAHVRVLDADAVRERFPILSTCALPFDYQAAEDHECSDHQSYLFEEEGGYCTDPAGASQDLMDAACRDGGDVRLRTAVVGIRTKGGRVRGVDLADGSGIDTPVIVNAAGPWCNRVNEMAGLELAWPLRPTRVQVMFRVSAPELSGGLPLIGDAAGGIYFRPESGGQQILVGSIRMEDESEPVSDPDRYDASIDEDMRNRLLYALHHRLPSLPYEGSVSGIAGLYTINNEDMHPILGPTELDGFIVANGMSGHGFKLAPAIGAMLARSIVGKSADFDVDVPIEVLSVGRDSLAVREKNVLA